MHVQSVIIVHTILQCEHNIFAWIELANVLKSVAQKYFQFDT